MNRVLNLGDSIRGANQIVNFCLASMSTHLDAITDVTCWLAGITERASYFHFDILNVNAALRCLSVKIVAIARCKSRAIARLR